MMSHMPFFPFILFLNTDHWAFQQCNSMDGDKGGGGNQIIFWRGCASRNPEMRVLRADYKHKI